MSIALTDDLQPAPFESQSSDRTAPTSTRDAVVLSGDSLATSSMAKPQMCADWGPIEAVFLADLHLGSHLEPRHFALRDFLAQLSTLPRKPAVYILGDLFNYWMGSKSERDEGNLFVLLCLRKAAESGIQVSFLPGNRDFFAESGYLAKKYGINMLGKKASLTLGRYRVLATHGDLHVLSDRSHVRLSWILRSAYSRYLANRLPRRFLNGIGRRMRKKSRGNIPTRDLSTVDIPAQEVARLLRGGYDVLICGHMHRVMRRSIDIDERQGTYFTLGPWEAEASVLVFDGEEFRFRSFPIAELG
jgi:UDP-2,3-diacylglucosamine hydrolase